MTIDERQRIQLVEDGMMKVREAAAFLGLGRSTIYEMMDSGRLPWAKIGGRRVIPRKAILSLAATAVVNPSALPTID